MNMTAIVDFESVRRHCLQCSLRELCIPAGIAGADVERVDRLVKKRRTVARGEYLFRAATRTARLYVARDGAFKTVASSEAGEQQVIGFHLAGELVGLDALASGRHRCDAIALETAHVCEIPLDDLHAVAAEVPGLQRQILRVIGSSVGRDHDHVELMGRRQADDRILLFLQGLSQRFSALGRDGDEFVLPMTREDIASYAGLVIETVSRSFTRLQDDGLIAVRGRRVRLFARERDETMAQCAPSVASYDRSRRRAQ
ncbi:helix-turn-helix domain-containing protein [Tahibacter sp.]|uniref:helix-turn-helix domain-containing protein n=1 Tax=Tahibacter sp. TaxID=2056211 RepID=UPI002D7E50F2|nr:helix-turn-helix domain-containing protein [Tahibacter sp.]